MNGMLISFTSEGFKMAAKTCDRCSKYQAFFLLFLPQNSIDDILHFSGKHWRKTRSTEVRLKMKKLDTCVRKFKAALIGIWTSTSFLREPGATKGKFDI